VTRQKIARATAIRMNTPEMRERMRNVARQQRPRSPAVSAHVTNMLRLRYGTKLQNRWIHKRNRRRPSYASIVHACFNNAQGKVAVVSCSRPTWSRELRWKGYAYRRDPDTGELVQQVVEVEDEASAGSGRRGVRLIRAVQSSCVCIV
jgi:hypothetical protein